MKTYQIFYIAGLALLIISVSAYFVGSLVIFSADDETAANLLGRKIQLDSNYDIQESISAFVDSNRFHYRWLLWFGGAIGAALIGIGLWLERKTEGPDLFLDDELDEDEEESSF
ncbi:MAG: hypothetical protein ONB13_13925 [candidate division KSB1 bacterium]|nr:hypothetical protein [candidate division KSB1 bacterium]MDZ7334038.1 hypothetical protein [candidate division KSB1 bacterium]MDZ7356890.1 hypothetical protein [candidate division KSB1 bacterium]MDZ7377702.1 hypothetical protein [candidate division KSB1 bacterium]MDZ7399526.1 hypothetical protein [candidate division KSB1 bacterium]